MSDPKQLSDLARSRRAEAVEQRAVQRDLNGEAVPERAARRRSVMAVSPFTGARIKRLAACRTDLRSIFREEESAAPARVITAPPGPVRSLPAEAATGRAGGEPMAAGQTVIRYSPRPRNLVIDLLSQVRQ